MRFLKTLTLNRRAIYDDRVALDVNNTFTVGTSNAMVLPKSSGSLTSVETEGMIRYNTSTHEVEVRSGNPAQWRVLRYNESNSITQQSLGYGDSVTEYFGPLNPAPPLVVANGQTWGGQNLLVYVENVPQIFNTNFVIENNPGTIPGVTYTPKTLGDALVGSTSISFDPTALAPWDVYPANAVDIVGATLSGSASIDAGTVILTYEINDDGRLITITIDKPLISATLTSGTALTISDGSNAGTGSYLKFSSPVPIGKPVTVIHGFDQ